LKRFTQNLPFITLLAGLLISFFSPGVLLAADGDTLDGWQQFERRVRDGEISMEEARTEITRWAEVLGNACPAEQFGREIFFPLKGYSVDAIGGKNGEGYRPAGYEFLGGNRHKGHPAQDIFIYDRNQDGLDDRTGRPAEVLALADGVVLASFAEWTPGETFKHIRGGNYVWIYHPGLRIFSYYAHLQDVFVEPGMRVEGGLRIATLGRTGTKAYPARSPTHLHLMLLRVVDMTPVDAYPLIAIAEKEN
jgi:murein DD-endopeptidase MepM/ murein hydrolase activator NlpD